MKIAVVLSSGGAAGLAHIGALSMLERFKIPIDMVVGASMGALVGGIYCAGKLDKFRKEVLSADKKKIYNLFISRPTSRGLILPDKIENFLYRYLKNIKIEKLKKKYACIALDLVSGEEVVINKGNLLRAILSSIALPTIFPPVKYESKILVDGGLFDPLPVEIAKRMNNYKVIAINISPEQKMNTKKIPNIMKIVFRLIHLSELKWSEKQLKKADLLINVNLKMSGFDYNNGERAIMAGEEAVLLAMPKIKKLLKKDT